MRRLAESSGGGAPAFGVQASASVSSLPAEGSFPRESSSAGGGPGRHSESPTPHSPIPRPRGVPSSRRTYPLFITGKQISLVRKLLNKRPDIRAEVRAMALVVQPRQIPGSQPAVDEGFGRGLRLVPVALHHLRPLAPQLAHRAGRRRAHGAHGSRVPAL